MYSVGLDFGTASCRGVLYNAVTGEVEYMTQFDYPHGVIQAEKYQQFVQHPQDYLDAMEWIIQQIKVYGNVDVTELKAIGIDFTSCTCLPVMKDFQHFATQSSFENNQNAYAKLWKSHSAEKEAKHIESILNETTLLNYYGGDISSEWLFPKLLELKNDAPEIFEDMAYFMEAGDWLVSLLTNQLSRSSCHAGFKGLFQQEDTTLTGEILKEIDGDFEYIYETKLQGAVQQVGTTAGFLSDYYVERLGLAKGTIVGVSIIDAHAALPGARITKANQLQIVMGTSACHLLLAKDKAFIPGIAGVVKDGILPDFYAYEAGQAAVGDLFQHFIDQKLPATIFKFAKDNNQSIYDYLNEQALLVQSHGLIILDWHNGSRTPYMNPNLSGITFGERLTTTAVEYYKALIESTAFGTKQIIEKFESHQIPINEVVFAGGIPLKNKLLMQVYADVLQKKLTVIDQPELSAVGAARLAIQPIYQLEPTKKLEKTYYFPQTEKYEKSYRLYKKLGETLSRNPLMDEINELKI